MSASANSGPQQGASSTDDMMAWAIMFIALIALLYFFGKDIIIAYWKGLRFLWVGLLNLVDPSFALHYGKMDALFLHQVSIGKVHWAAANLINHSIDKVLSIGSVGIWPILWSILPMALAIPLWNKKKGLRIQFKSPWDLARFFAPHYPWMMPVIRQREAELKTEFKKGAKTSLKMAMKEMQFRDQKSDWPLHPLEVLINIGAITKDGEFLADRVKDWMRKQLGSPTGGSLACGSPAGRDGFSTPERNALFHAFVNKDTQAILKSYASSEHTIQKHARLDDADLKRFVEYRKKHAYEVTILLSALMDARKKTLVPPNWFVWIKYKERALWYALHGLQMPRPHSEGLPGLVQWHCEQKAGVPITAPQSQFVLSGLQESLQEINWQKSKTWKAYVH